MDISNGNIPRVSSEKKSYGPLIAVIIILLLIIIGGLYFLGQRMNSSSYSPSVSPEGDSVEQSLQIQSDSDDVSSIEADLKATNVDTLDGRSE